MNSSIKSQPLTTHQLILEEIRDELEPAGTSSISHNVTHAIIKSPNKLFWISSFFIACIGKVIIIIFYYLEWTRDTTEQQLYVKLTHPEPKIETGTKPVFTVFWIGFVIYIGYLIHCFRELCYKKPKKDESKLESGNTKPEWTKQSTMYLIQRRIKVAVKDAYETECAQKRIHQSDGVGRKLIALERASKHVMGGYKGVDIISQCQLESVNRRSNLLSFLFKVRNHYLWTIFMHIVVITHVALCFFESKWIRTNDTWTIFGRQFYIGVHMTWKQAVPEFTLVSIEFFDVIIRILWIHLCPIHILRPKSERLYAYLNFLTLVYIACDLIINLTIGRSLEYLIPVRPLLLILINATLRKEVATLIKSIYEILPILRMYGLVVMFCGIMAFIIFGDLQHSTEALQSQQDQWKAAGSDEDKDQAKEDLDDLIGNIDCFWFSVRSILTMFVFVSSGENYTTVVYPGMQIYKQHAGIVLLFFVPVIFLGMFTMMAMITGVFEDVFTEKEIRNRMRDLWWKRTGIISSFLLLDYNDDGLLTLDELIDFVLFLNKDNKHNKKNITRSQIIKLFKILDTDNSGTIELNEFVNGVEKLCDEYNHGFDQHMISRVIESADDSKYLCITNILAIAEKIWLSWAMNKLRGFLFLFNFWIFCWINIIDNNTIAFVTNIFLCIHICDVFITMLVMKPHRYLFYSKYDKHEIITEFANRSDLVIVSCCLCGYIIGVTLHESRVYFNIVSALILLRVFIFWDVSLRFLFMIKSAFSSLSALFVVMFCVFFTYGTIGVSLFKGESGVGGKLTEQQGYMRDGYGNANFENLQNAMITLVQVFVGEAFHEIMLATKEADGGDNWSICFFIISYFLIMTLLFGNLFFGLLLSIFGSLYDIHQSGAKLTGHTIKKASQLRLMSDEEGDDTSSQ